MSSGDSFDSQIGILFREIWNQFIECFLFRFVLEEQQAEPNDRFENKPENEEQQKPPGTENTEPLVSEQCIRIISTAIEILGDRDVSIDKMEAEQKKRVRMAHCESGDNPSGNEFFFFNYCCSLPFRKTRRE